MLVDVTLNDEVCVDASDVLDPKTSQSHLCGTGLVCVRHHRSVGLVSREYLLPVGSAGPGQGFRTAGD